MNTSEPRRKTTLSGYHKAFEDDYSEEEIRLMRIKFISDMGN